MPGHSRLARLLRAYLLAQVLAALGCILWRWPEHPIQATAGALLILLIGPVVLGLEFLMLAFVARTVRDVPVPSASELLGAWLSESRHLFSTFYWRQPFRANSIADSVAPAGAGRTGVVFVHGFMCNRGFWTPWMKVLRANGHAFVAVNLEPIFGSIDEYGRIIDEAVALVASVTGRPPVLICHSMGGLAARAWWRRSRAQRPIAHLVTIGTPHRGTWLGRFSRRLNARQMHLDSAWLKELAVHENGCALPPLTCWYSNCDNIVFPASTATLPCATNRFVPGVPHVALAFRPEVMQATLSLLDRKEDAASR